VRGGAVERIIEETAGEMPCQTVVSPWDPDLTGEKIKGSFEWVDVEAESEDVAQRLKCQVGDMTKDQIARFAYLNCVASIIEELAPDIIEVHNRVGALDYLQREFPERKTLLHMYNELGPSGSTYERALRKVDQVVFVSAYLRNRGIRRFPFLRSKSQIVHNAVHPADWRVTPPRRRGRHVLFVGRTTRTKGAHLAVEAFAKVKRVVKGARMTIVGTPFFGLKGVNKYHRELERRAGRVGSVVFTGHVPYQALRETYQSADLLLVPSLFEDPLPCVVLEAMASGLPVLASPKGGIPEMVEHGKTGWLCDPRRNDAFAETAVHALLDHNIRRSVSQCARTRIESRFARSQRIEKLNEIYATV
jgi:spore coat protein SA